jgi:Subtilase family
MSEQQRPVLLFPRPTSSEREKLPTGRTAVHIPTATRQAERLAPKFERLQSAFDAGRIRLQAATPVDGPELVIVFETVGSVENFIGAVQRTPGLEWLLDSDEADLEPDNDFYNPEDPQKRLDGRFYLLGSNQQALAEVISLWNRYQNDAHVQLERGLAKWKDVFKHLRDVRPWGAQDRIGQDIRGYLESQIEFSDAPLRFELEAWCFASLEKNNRAAEELKQLVSEVGGRVISSTLIQDIAYHGFLIEMPTAGVRSLLSDTPPALVLSERVMLFRPRGQAFSAPQGEDRRFPALVGAAQPASGPPVVAVLDGLPIQNHPLLAGRLSVDDPDEWESDYPAKDRVHGTAMTSLVVYGELDGPRVPLSKPLYVRPIMRPDSRDTGESRRESTPDDELLIDLVHRAVKRMFVGEAGGDPAAPTVKVVNLSIGDSHKPYDTELSPWARLLDWLSYKHQVLFVVSAGNASAQLNLPVPRDTLSTLSEDERLRLAVSALVSNSVERRVLSPGESINAITVGAVHTDGSRFVQASNRFDLFPNQGISPYSCIGNGFRRSIKPDILMPGGRVLHREKPIGGAGVTELQLIDTSAAPGHRVAAPPDLSGQNTKYARGTSNAAALATRGAAQAHSVIEVLRASSPERLPSSSDAVLLKALLVHGAEWGNLEAQIIAARPDITEWRERQNLVTRFIGYGLSDIDRAITCTEQRATLLGTGELSNGEALEFRVPLPPSLKAKLVKRRLTITLAWMSPVHSRQAKYRAARLWIKPPHTDFDVSRMNCDWQRVQRGTVQHEVLEGTSAIPFADGANLIFKVNCAEDGGKLLAPVPFALCVTLEVAEGIDLPIYQEVRERVNTRINILS